MRKYSVYIHTNKVNGKRYIGVTTGKPEIRWANGNGYKSNSYFSAAIKKYGWNNFDHFILEVNSPELMYRLEQQYISYYKTTDNRYGYNISLGGECGNYQGKDSHTKEYQNYYQNDYCKSHKEEKKQYDKQYRLDNRLKISDKNHRFYLKHKKPVEIDSIKPLW